MLLPRSPSGSRIVGRLTIENGRRLCIDMSSTMSAPPRFACTVAAGFFGWTLDGFDFTIFIFVMVAIAKEFGVSVTALAGVLTVTLWLRLFVLEREGAQPPAEWPAIDPDQLAAPPAVVPAPAESKGLLGRFRRSQE